jgi:hypothetical protein
MTDHAFGCIKQQGLSRFQEIKFVTENGWIDFADMILETNSTLLGPTE